jgi:hypothetical protein
MRASELTNRLKGQPFKPFRIHMSDGNVFDILYPGMVLVGRDQAVIPRGLYTNQEGRPIPTGFRTVSLENMVEISELRAPSNGRGRRKK